MAVARPLRLVGPPEPADAVAAAWTLPADPAVEWFPGEAVLLLAVRLPAMTPAERRSALPFAVEDRIAQPLEEVQVVAGPRLSDGSWLVAVVARTALDAVAARSGPGPAPRLVPDILCIAPPASGWAAVGSAGRALVRCADGTGFAAAVADLPLLWQAAGRPPVTLHAGALPAGIEIRDRAPLPPPDPALARFDLGAGHQGMRAPLWPRWAGRVAALAVLAAAGHLAVLAADIVALDRLVDRREAALRAQLVETGAPAGGELDTALAAALAARRPAMQDGFLAVMARVAAAPGLQGGTVGLRDLRYAATPPAITATFEASDLGTLQAAEAGLKAAGLAVVAGAATSADGVAEVSMQVTGGGP